MIERQNIRPFFMNVRRFYYSTIINRNVDDLYDLKFKSHIQCSFPAERRYPGLTFINPGLTFIKELLRIQAAPI